ncbi:AAA family ATPase [Streptomyces sp. NPDC088180]|uniref:AAA family ATPase n=1 Tax=Streptomyces sp. NPDC088180 TaxID=3365837 RepID=UPI00380ACBC6
MPEHSLVVLIGPSGAGKSTIARTWPASQVLSLDALREVVSDNAGDQGATRDAVAALHLLLDATPSVHRRRQHFPDDSLSSSVREASVDRVASGVGSGPGPVGRPPDGGHPRGSGSACGGGPDRASARRPGVRCAGRHCGSRAPGVRPVGPLPVPGAGDEAELCDGHPAAPVVSVLAWSAVAEGQSQ